MSSKVSCAPWQDLLLGSATTYSATYDECAPDTVVISTNAVTASGATSDNQEIVYQELCGDGQLIAKVSALSGGYAGLFVRESNAAGARKGAIMTQKGSSVFRHLRITTNGIQFQASYTASGHQWLKINRSGTQVIGSWSTNGTSWNVAFNTALSMTDCVVIGMAAFSTSSGTTINATFTNISVAQSDTIPATEVAFADSTLAAQGGDTVQICVNLENPCYCSPVSVDVALATDSLPHLTGYAPQALTFEEGDTVQCFTVVLEESDSSATYTFELTNLEGGNNSEIGAIGELVLEVETNEAEEEPGLCGSFIKDSTLISEGDKLFYDRFGNTYTDKEILKSSNLTEECGCGEFSNTDISGVEESYFKLTFDDCVFETGGGFDQAGATGVARRKVACKVFTYLSQLITPKSYSCEGFGLAEVNVRFMDVNSPAVMQYVGTATLAGASPYFDNNSVVQEGGILDCLPWRVINNGYYTAFDQIASSAIFHGEMAVDFNKTFYLDDGLPVPGNAYDLYSVLLHEALHFLGFASLIQPITGIPNLSADAISYGRYDTFLKLAGGNNVVAKDMVNPYQWNLNIPAGDLHKSCHPTDNIDMVFPPLTGTDIPVYTGSVSDGGAFLNGRAFSHLHPNCNGTTPNYLMKPEFDLGMRLEPGEAELKILCALGYNITGIEDCACIASGNHDFTEGCDGEPFEMEICEEAGFLDIDLADLLANDQPGVEVSYLTSTTPDANSIEDIGGGMIRFIPCAPGLHQLKYIPTKDGCTDGSTVLITIKVTRCIDDCTFFSTDDPVNAGYYNPCNLVCNPEVVMNNPGEPHESVASLEQNIFGICYDLPGWFSATGTPDYLALPTVTANSGSIQLQSRGDGESVFTPVDAGPGTYFCSFYATCATGNTSSGSISINAKLVDDNIVSQFSRHTGSPGGVGQINESLGESLFLSTLTVPFTQTASFAGSNRRKVSCVEVPEGETYDALWFYTSGGSTSFTVRSYVDQVELIPDNFGLGEDLTIPPGCEIELGKTFCMLSDVTIHYEWFEEVDNALVSIMAYNVLNGVATADDPEDPDNDDFDFDTQILTVTPNQTTTYVLQRSIATPNNLPAGFELCTTEDEVVVEIEEEMPGLSLVSENCGLVTFSATGILPGHIWSIDYGNGITGTSLVHKYTLTPDTYTATLTVTNDCGTIEIPLEVSIEGCP
ncbi:MAG: PKD domain-containing protein, partial [Saprospiraceae bacterium]|nr:PKD domain-containing protein [Saprospiraceae bacterium]